MLYAIPGHVPSPLQQPVHLLRCFALPRAHSSWLAPSIWNPSAPYRPPRQLSQRHQPAALLSTPGFAPFHFNVSGPLQKAARVIPAEPPAAGVSDCEMQIVAAWAEEFSKMALSPTQATHPTLLQHEGESSGSGAPTASSSQSAPPSAALTASVAPVDDNQRQIEAH